MTTEPNITTSDTGRRSAARRSTMTLAALAVVAVMAGVMASPAAAWQYWDGTFTQVEVNCTYAEWGYSSVITQSTTTVASGSPHYWVDVYNGPTLILRSNRWIPSGQGLTIYSSPFARYWGTHMVITHARFYNGRWNYYAERNDYFFSAFQGPVDDCLF